MAADLAAFRARFPEFADSADALVERSLEDAALIHSVRDAATLYCAAHLLTLAVGRAGEDGAEGRSEIRSEGSGPAAVPPTSPWRRTASAPRSSPAPPTARPSSS